MKKIAVLLVVSLLISSCERGVRDPESFLVYSSIFESLSDDFESTISNKEFWLISGKPCFFKIDDARYSYVSALVDVGFGVTAWNDDMNASTDLAVDLLKFMVENGCTLDELHPYTGHSTAHNAAFFTKKNFELAKYVFQNSNNLMQRTPKSDPNFPNLTALEILEKIVSEHENQEKRLELINLIKPTHNKLSQQDAASGASA